MPVGGAVLCGLLLVRTATLSPAWSAPGSPTGEPPAAPSAASDTRVDAFRADELARLRRIAAETTVRVSGRSCGRPTTGTGFAVDGVVVTNSHLVGGEDPVLIDRPETVGEGAGFLSAVATVAWREDRLDLAGLLIADPSESPLTGLSPAEVTVAAPVVGEPVLLSGYGGGRRLGHRDGTVHLVVDGRSYGVAGTVVLIDGESGPGFSGGPVLNRDGAVVAVLKGVDRSTGLTVAVAATEVVPHISTWKAVQSQTAKCN